MKILKPIISSDFLLIGLVLFLIVVHNILIFELKDFIKSGEIIFRKTILYSLLSIGLILFFYKFFNIKRLRENKIFILGIYFFFLVMLILPFFLGKEGYVKRWIDFGFFSFQPSEFAKIGIIFLYSKFFSRRFFDAFKIKHIAGSFLYIFPILILIVIEPDFSTGFLYFLYWVLLLFILRIKPLQVAGILLVSVLIGFLSWNYVLEEYQRQRAISFLFPQRDPLGYGYSIIQSKIAIASGGFFGKGISQIYQAKLGFLPNAYNDFIFSVYFEAFGFFGALILILVYIGIINIMKNIFLSQVSVFNKIFVLSYIIFFSLGVIFNIGGAVGIVPITGNSLPFLSYGGSNFLSHSILMGIVLSFSKERKSGGKIKKIL